MTRGFSKYIWPLELPNHDLSDRVDKARHALAIDEERTAFAPELWEESDSSLPSSTKQETLSQVCSPAFMPTWAAAIRTTRSRMFRSAG
jgi:hypothetical protein